MKQSAKSLLRWARWPFGCVLLAVLIWKIQQDTNLAVPEHVSWSLIVSVVILQWLAVCAGTLRWFVLVRDHALPIRSCLRYFLIGRFFGAFTPSTLGLDGYRALAATDALRSSFRDEAAVVSASAIGVEKIIGLTGMALITCATYGYQGRWMARWMAFVAALVLFVALLLVPSLQRRTKTGGWGSKLQSVVQGILAVPPKDRLLALGLGAFTHLFLASSYAVAAISVGAKPDLAPGLVWVGNTIQLGLLAPITVAGLGVREGIAVYGMGKLGVPAITALLATSITFLATQIPAVVGGILWLLDGKKQPNVSRETFRESGSRSES